MEIIDSKPVWVAWTNTDLTEGRGAQVPYVVGESYEVAQRLGQGGSVMGSNCEVTECVAVKVEGLRRMWLVPGRIESENLDDQHRREKREAREKVMETALKLGLTPEEVDLLAGNT